MSVAADAAAVHAAGDATGRWPSLLQRVAVTVLALLAGSWLGLQGLRTPPPVEPQAAVFSAVRAAETARRALGESPRPVGSAASLLAVERLADLLRQRGMEVQLDEATVKTAGREVRVRNIVARRTGTKPGSAVMLMAHHDSVGGAPGAGDDGMGVAIVLEAAGALCSGPWKGRDVILLLTDGEEAGLLGARHFAANHPWRDQVGAVLNVDNRGNRGPCLLYETSGPDARLMQAAAPFMGPVVANSLFAEIARHMPNSTDLAVFRELGVPGLNFALIDGHEHYHAPTDTWQNADLSSLQHEGEMALAALYALAMQPEEGTRSDGRAVFLDIGGSVLAWWPARAGLTGATLCTAGVMAAAYLGCRHRRVRARQVAIAAAATVAQAAAALLACAGLLWLASIVGLYGLDVAKAAQPDAHPLTQYAAAFWPSFGAPLLVVCMTAALAAAWFASRPITRRLDGMATIWGAWMVLGGFVTAVALTLPGASAPLLPILLAATVAIAVGTFALEARAPMPALLALAASAFMAGLTLAPIEALSWIGVGLSMPAYAGLRVAIYAAVLLPALTADAARPRTA